MPFQMRYDVLFRQFRLLTAQAGSIPAAIRLIFENCYKSNNSVNMWDLRAHPAILCLKASGTALCDSQRLYAAWCRQVGQEDSKTKNKPAKKR